MGKTILPSGEEVFTTPSELLRYLDADGLRQILRQERLRWLLKTNKDVDYYDNTTLFKFSGEVHNEGLYQRMEIRTFPDNGAYAGYAGINNDSGVSGIVHNLDKWSMALSDESKDKIINRTMVGAMATVEGKPGYGIDDDGNESDDTTNRSAMMLCDPFDGRIYALTSDEPFYANNESRMDPLPGRTVARICDIPTRATQLLNDIHFVTDPSYSHTDNNFTNSNRFVLDNLDDRTFVYPEISKDSNGNYINNIRYGLNGEAIYEESDVVNQKNTQPDPTGARGTEAVSSYNKNTDFSGLNTPDGYLQGIFRSIEELEKVDLVGQKMVPNNSEAPGAKRTANYYIFDGVWSSNWFDRVNYPDSYLASSMNPNNMEIHVPDEEPYPYKAIDVNGEYSRADLYQWRYNRVDVVYPSQYIDIRIVEAGEGYTVGDILRWTFGDDSFAYRVDVVGANGQLMTGTYMIDPSVVYDHDPSTHGVGIEFNNTSSGGHGARLAISAQAVVTSHATQLKNNLYAYVDVVPTVSSDNSSPWSDNKTPDTQGGKIVTRSTAPAQAFSGVNSGRGGDSPAENTNGGTLYEHGGNATAGAHVHLFRYVINTENPTWVIKDGVQVYTGRWVDQGPMGVERPADIKALFLSNPDTNCFNNYYKFMFDMLIDTLHRNPDAIYTNNPNAVSIPYIHIDQKDPDSDRRFTDRRIDPVTGEIIDVDITARVIYINAATGSVWCYNSGPKNDPTFGYGYRTAGWFIVTGAITR